MSDRAAKYREAGWWTGQRLVDRVAANVESSPDAAALVAGSDRLTLGELWHLAGERADHLAGEIGTDRRVVLIDLPNDASWLVTFLAVLRGGYVPATAPLTASASHLAHVIDLVDPAMAITCTADVNGYASSAVQEAAGIATASPGVALIDGADMTVVTGPGRPQSPHADLHFTDHLMLTSSTTGLPKAVSHTEDSLATLNQQFADRFELDHSTPIFMPSPLGHSVGAIHGARLALYLGALLVVQDRWDPQQALRLATEHGAAFTAAATPFLLDLANAAPLDADPKFSSVRTFLCGGAQVPPELLRRCRQELPNTFVTPLWGMTEGGLTTCLRESPPERVDTTVGVPLPGLEVRVMDPDGAAHSEGEGELIMAGPGVFNGYYGQPELYAEALTSDGFFRTGDLAKIHSDGYVEITGRIKDLIIRGAVNISPVDTENVIAAHPDVRGVAVIGWPDDRLGERLCAVVDATTDLTFDELIEFCRQRGLPKRYWPERLELVEEFPRTAVGKIRKQQLRNELVARHELVSRTTPSADAAPQEERTMTRQTLGDFDVNYETVGSGPAVVLLHGLAEDLHSWDPLLPGLSEFTVYAVDLRGHGGSSVGAGDGTVAQLAADLERFVREVSGPAMVVGYSLGGTIALRAAAEDDSLIQHVIAVASSSVVGRGAADFFAGRIAQIENQQWDDFAAGLRDDTRQQVVTDVDLDALTASRLAAVGDGQGYVNAATAMINVRSAPLTDDLARIKVAVDVVGADSDVFCPRKAADLIVEGVPRGRYHEIEGAGHLISVDQPARYSELISRLLKEALI